MSGLMQKWSLAVPSILAHAARHHGSSEILSAGPDGTLHRYTYYEAERRARRLAKALIADGIQRSDRVATLAWNGHRHLEIYYGASGASAVCHTVNPRLSPDDIAYIIVNAGDSVVFTEPDFVPLLSGIADAIGTVVEKVIVLGGPEALAEAHESLQIPCVSYEEFLSSVDDDFAWPEIDENAPCALCYTSGTTGRPKGVLYSHRATVLHAMAINFADAFGFKSVDRVMPVVPMFHVNAWGIPFAAPMVGASLVLPGRQLDGQSLLTLMKEQAVTFAAGVPTVWRNVLECMRSTGARLDPPPRLLIGGAACPEAMMDAFATEFGIEVNHAWGMTEISPVGVVNRDKASSRHLGDDERKRQRRKQGRALYGIDYKLSDADGAELPWNGSTSGRLMTRGHWVVDSYLGAQPGTALEDGRWFDTGDVATIDGDGYVEITDRLKDVVKSGGEWISSIVLENLAMAHPSVAEAAVIAAAHPKWDERPLLIVVPRDPRSFDGDALLRTIEGRVAKWWLPDAVVCVESLPHTATGKVQKTALRDLYRDFLLRPDALQGRT